MSPTKIKVLDKRELHVLWEDNSESVIPLSVLRKNCPCAACLLERQSKPSTYIPLFSHVQLMLSDIRVIGSYAVQLVWQDGHDDGIYNYGFLKELGRLTPNPSPKERG